MVDKALFLKKSEYIFGNWKITLNTDKDAEHPKFFYSALRNIFCEGACFFPALSVNVWYISQSDSFEKKYDYIKSQADEFIPRGLLEFYSAMDKVNIPHLPLEEHCNRYFRYKNLVLGEFPYPTDNFKFICDIENKDIYLLGQNTAINRILNDCISILSKVLPIHGSAVAENGKATCFLGDSGSGKTFLLLLMMKAGAFYVADDELFLVDGKIYSLYDFVHIRSGLIDQFLLKDSQIIPAEKISVDAASVASGVCREAVVEDCYIISNKSEPSYLQWFPCVARQSYWWLVFFENINFDLSGILNKVSASQKTVQEILNKKEIRSLDFKKIKEYYEGDFSLKTDNILKEVFK